MSHAVAGSESNRAPGSQHPADRESGPRVRAATLLRAVRRLRARTIAAPYPQDAIGLTAETSCSSELDVEIVQKARAPEADGDGDHRTVGQRFDGTEAFLVDHGHVVHPP